MEQNITLTDLIDAETLQKIQDAFANATGMAALTVDLNGAVTTLSNPTDFCMKFTRGCPKGAERCNKCDLEGGETAAKTGNPAVYYCHGGLMDFAAPILLEGKQIGSLIGGQVLPEPADPEKFRRIARELEINENSYIDALSKIKIVPKKTIEASAELLYIMANSLSSLGYQKYISKILSKELIDVSGNVREKIHNSFESIKSIRNHNSELSEKINTLVDLANKSKQEVNETKEVIKYINDVAMQTKLLGFNASVEAAHAKEYGLGFNIIAQEMRKLTESSQTQYKKIDSAINTIKHTVAEISDYMNDTYSIVDTNTKELSSIFEIINQISNYSEKLKNISDELKKQ